VENGEQRKIGVIGAGSWGTALADLMAEKGHDVTLWVREDEVYEGLVRERKNPVFLPDVRVNPALKPLRTYREALEQREILLLVVPSHVARGVVRGMRPFLRPDVGIVSCTKGIENDTLMMISQVLEQELTDHETGRFACLAGPSFAREVAGRAPTAVTVASSDAEYARELQSVFSTESFRVYASQDLVGAQLAGALKNVIAVGAGISDGLGFGHNARAALITRGLAEITRLAVVMGANPHTLAGLAGMGDLVLTCTGDLSRNRTLGLHIGHGRRPAEVVSGMKMVAEGFKTALSAHELGKTLNVELPIIDQVYRVLYEGKDPREAVRDLMTRELRVELEH